MTRPNTADDLWRQTERSENGCLEWTGPTDKDGYGRIRFGGKNVLVHRLAWMLSMGPIPPGVKVLHHCDNPPCCDVDKCLFLGTQADNVVDMAVKLRGSNQKKTHCPQGHPYSPENTYVRLNGWRLCRKCSNIRRDKYRT